MSWLKHFLFLCLACHIAVAAPRVAVIAPPVNEDAAALLTNTLSSLSTVEVMERSALAAISREKGLANLGSDPAEYSRIGQLLGVDALIILEPSPDGKALSTRLVGVGSGVIVDESTVTWPLDDIDSWAKFLAFRFSELVNNMPTASGPKVLVGLLGLRSATASQLSQSAERETTFLLARSLAHVPGVFVLERSRLRETDWEKQLATQATSQYWTSSWLLDGSVTHGGNKLSFDRRLRAIGVNTTLPILAEGTNPQSLSEAISAKVAPLLKLAPPARANASAEEAGRFQEEAAWGLRWQLLDQAEQAADASWALGNKTEQAGLLRALAPARKAAQANKYVLSDSKSYGRTPPPTTLDDMTRAFENLRQLPGGQAGKIPSPAFSEAAAEILQHGSEVLASYYYQPVPRTPDEDARMRWMRAQIRELAPTVAKGTDATIKQLDRVQAENLRQDQTKYPSSFYVTGGSYSPLWGDTPEQSREQFTSFRNIIHQAPPEWHLPIKDWSYLQRKIHSPLIAAWAVADRPRVQGVREQLFDTLETSRDPRDRLDAAALQIWRYHSQMQAVEKKIPDDRVRESFATCTTLLDSVLQPLSKNEVDPAYLSSVFAYAMTARGDYPSLPADYFHPLYKRYLSYLIQNKWGGEESVYGALLQKGALTPAERDQLLALLPGLQAAHPNRKRLAQFLDFRIKDATVNQSETQPAVASAPTSSPALKPTKVIPISPQGSPAVINSGFGRGNTFTLAYSRTEDPRRHVQEIDATTGQAQEYTYPEASSAPGLSATFATDGEFFFYFDKGELFRITKGTGAITKQAIPMLGKFAQQMWVVKDHLYAANSSTIVRIDRQTLEPELIASAQRRPSRTVLDDQPSFEVDAIFADRQGAIWVATRVVGKLYRWDESRRNFEAISNPMRNQGLTFDRSLYLSWVGSDHKIPRSNDPETYLLIDKERVGRAPFSQQWPPRFEFPAMQNFQNRIMAKAAVGSRLYATYLGGEQMYLRVMDDEQGRTFSIPIDLHQQPRQSRYNTMIANNEGILFYDQTVNDLLYFSKEDIDAFAATNGL